MAVTTQREVNYIREYETATTGALAYTTSTQLTGTGKYLKEIRVHLNAVGASGTLTVSIDSGIAATVYDVVLDSQDMTAVTDYIYIPPENGKHYLFYLDQIKIAWANAGNKTYGYEVIYEVC